jgi:hypothetical protein
MHKLNYYLLPKEASLLSNHLRRFRSMLNKGLFPHEAHHFPEDNFFFTNKELADFCNFSESTARRLRKKGIIKSTRHGNCVLTPIASVMDTIANNDHLASLFTRKRPVRRPKKPPVFRYRATQRGSYMFVYIHCYNLKATYICEASLWNNGIRILDLVRDIISNRFSCQPTKTTGHEKN